MEQIAHAAVRVAAFEAHTMSDAALLRLARGASEVVALTSAAGNDLAARWAMLVPHTPLVDGGFVRDLRQAMGQAARQGIGQIAIATPRDVSRTIGFALQGAASAAELDVPAVGVRIMRNADGGEGVALFTDTGEPSGYATLFAMGLAELDAAELTTLSAKQAGRLRRGSDGLMKAIEQAEPKRARMTERAVLDPLNAVLAQDFGIAVHAMLDVRVGGDLLGAQELGPRSLEGVNVRRLLRLVDEFKGDVVLVLDGVRLLHGRRRAQRTAAGIGMEFGAIAGATYVSTAASEPPVTARAADVRQGPFAGGISIPELADEVPPAQLEVPSFPPAPRVPVKSSALRYPDQVVLRVADGDTVLVTNPTREPLRVVHFASVAADPEGGLDTSQEIATVPIGRVDQRVAIPFLGVDPAVPAGPRSISVATADGAFRVELYSKSGAFEPGDMTHEHVPPSLLPERPVASPQPRYVERETVEPLTFVVPVLDEIEVAEPEVGVNVESGEELAVASAPDLEPEPVVDVEPIVDPKPEPVVDVEPIAEPLSDPEPIVAVGQVPEPEADAASSVTEAAVATSTGPVPIPPGAMFDPISEPEPPPTPRQGTRRPVALPVPPVSAERPARVLGMSRRERRLAQEAAQLREQATLAQEI